MISNDDCAFTVGMDGQGRVCYQEPLSKDGVGGVYALDHVILGGGNCTAQGPCWYKDICPTEKAAGAHAVVYCVDARNVMLTPELAHTLQSKPGGGKHP